MNSHMKMKLFREAFLSHGFDASIEAVQKAILGLCTELMSPRVTKYFTNFAFNLFDEMKQPNSGTVNIVIRTLCDVDHVEQALSFIKKQEVDPKVLYPHTLSSMINVCNRHYASQNNTKWWLNLGDSIHSITLKLGHFQKQPVLHSLHSFHAISGRSQQWFVSTEAINQISYFSANRNVTSARVVFDDLPCSARTVHVWNSMMNAYISSRQNQNVLDLFELMKRTSCVPNEDTYLIFIKASKALGLRDTMLEVEEIEKCLLQVTNHKPSALCKNVLVDLFGKAGDCKSAWEYFNSIKDKNMYSWNTMLTAFAHNGKFEDCMNLYQKMLSENISPDSFTFVALLFACSSAGRFSEGLELFNRMQTDFGIIPNVRHHTNMVTLIGGTQNARQAYRYIEDFMTEVKPNKITWGALLSCVNMAEEIDIAELANSKLPNGEGLRRLRNIYRRFNFPDKAMEISKILNRPHFTNYRVVAGTSAIGPFPE